MYCALCIVSYYFQVPMFPLTTEGNILVDGILASCYAIFDHDTAHVVMKPLLWFPRMMDLLLGDGKSTHTYLYILEFFGKIAVPNWQSVL